LLRIQLHLVARSILMGESLEIPSEDGEFDNNQLFRAFIEKTYKQLFGNGLSLFTDHIQSILRPALREWTVKEKFTVDYDEFIGQLSAIRQVIEKDFDVFLRTLFIRKFVSRFFLLFSFLLSLIYSGRRSALDKQSSS
jgi:hypothetical protein